MNTQSGMSLVEVMLAMLLGLFLIAGFIQIYLSTQKTFYMQQALTELQENGRFAAHFLSENIRMAGYAYCDTKEKFVNTDLALQGYDKTLPIFLNAQLVKAGADTILIGSCATRDEKNTFEQFALFVGPTGRKNKLGKTIYALYEKSVSGPKHELVAGVEDMKISYGVVNQLGDRNIADYLAADDVQDWKKVRAVKIALLLASTWPALTKPQAYEFAGNTLPADRFLRREWHVYVVPREFSL